jgi:antitoxin MazE7
MNDEPRFESASANATWRVGYTLDLATSYDVMSHPFGMTVGILSKEYCWYPVGMSEMTTIKVPKDLREAVMQSARAEGLTAADFLRRLIEEHARRQRFAAVRLAYAGGARDRDYDEITAAWDQAGDDGLTDA